jgi:Calcineurin-like phosphoesterase
MTDKIKRIVSVLCLVAAICAAALLPASGYAENLRFVFMADSRGDHGTPIINTPVLDAINNKILTLSPRPSFVIFGGDQAFRGYSDGAYTFEAFKTALEPLTKNGITLYTAIGNHELYGSAPHVFQLANQRAYQKAFARNPANGPTGYEHLVYSFPSPGGDAFFAVLDPYYLTNDVPAANTAGTLDATQLNWLTGQLALTKATHKFLFIHTPYYYVNTLSHPADITFTNLWNILDQNCFDMYFCGHAHLYSRKDIDSSIAPYPQLTPPVQWKSNVVQVLNGTCGAPVDTACLTVDRTLWHVFNDDNTYYFSVVDINGPNVKVTTYGGNTGDYRVIDSFSVDRGFFPCNYLLPD